MKLLLLPWGLQAGAAAIDRISACAAAAVGVPAMLSGLYGDLPQAKNSSSGDGAEAAPAASSAWTAPKFAPVVRRQASTPSSLLPRRARPAAAARPAGRHGPCAAALVHCHGVRRAFAGGPARRPSLSRSCAARQWAEEVPASLGHCSAAGFAGAALGRQYQGRFSNFALQNALKTSDVFAWLGMHAG